MLALASDQSGVRKCFSSSMPIKGASKIRTGNWKIVFLVNWCLEFPLILVCYPDPTLYPILNKNLLRSAKIVF